MADNSTPESNEVLYSEEPYTPGEHEEVNVYESESSYGEDSPLADVFGTPGVSQADLAKEQEAARAKARKAARAKVRKTAETLLYETDRPDLNTQQICFLRDNMPQIVQESRSTINVNGWDSFATFNDNDISSFASKIFGQLGPGTQLLDITTLEKSFLVPRVYLKKVVIDADTKKIVRDIPMYFPNNSAGHIASILNSGVQDDYGIVSTTVDFKNQNPFSAGRMVDVNIQIYLVNAASLTRNRGGYAVADLILRRNQVDPEIYDGGHYQVVLEVGYQQPNTSQGLVSPAIKEGIDRSVVSMTLQMVDYDLSFEQNGVINLSIDYKARVEAMLEDKEKYDIFDGGLKDSPTSAAYRPGGKYYALIEEIKRANKDIAEGDAELERLPAEYQAELESARAKAISAGNQKGGAVATGTSYTVPSNANVQAAVAANPDAYPHEIKKKYEEKTKNINKDISAAIAARDFAKKELASYKYENKVAKYGRLFEILYERGKVRSFVVDEMALVTYGPEFDKRIQDEVDKAMEASDPLLADALDDEVESIKDELRDAVRTNFVNSGGQGGVEINFANDFKNHATEYAKKNGGDSWVDSAKSALETFDVGASVNPKYKNSAQAKKTSDSKGLGGRKVIYWVYAGDIIEVGLRMFGIADQMKQDKIKTIMGPVNIPVGDNTVYNTTISDIPITLEAFQQYFYKNIISRDVDQYFVINFLRDVTNKLVAPAINQRCFGRSQEHPTSIKTNVMETREGIFFGEKRYDINLSKNKSGYVETGGGAVFVGDGEETNTLYISKRDLKLDGVPSNKRDNILMFYGADGRINKKWNGRRGYDQARGIYHFYIGKDRGLVKEVKFTKNKAKYQTEMMVERQMSSNEEYLELWSIFDIQLTMVGNSLLRPGMHIFLNPDVAAFGTLSKALGLGGYYMVVSVSNSIGKDGWETSVIAKWVSGGANAASSDVVEIAPTVVTASQLKEYDQSEAEAPPIQIQEAEETLEEEGYDTSEAVTVGSGAGTKTVGAVKSPSHGELADSLTEFDETAELIMAPTSELEDEYGATNLMEEEYINQGKMGIEGYPMGKKGNHGEQQITDGKTLYHVEDTGYGYAFGEHGEGGFEVIGTVTPDSYDGPAGSFESSADYIDPGPVGTTPEKAPFPSFSEWFEKNRSKYATTSIAQKQYSYKKLAHAKKSLESAVKMAPPKSSSATGGNN